MALPPNPDQPVIRFRLGYSVSDGTKCGQRMFLAYTGGPPTGPNLVTLATDIAAAWNTNLNSLINSEVSLTDVTCQDIATADGFEGEWTGDNPGTSAGGMIPISVAVNIEFDITRRYRGGKPRTYQPPPGAPSLADPAHWDGGYVDAVNSSWAAFFAELAGLTVGTTTGLTHVAVSFYQPSPADTPDRDDAPEEYRTTAKTDIVTGYACKFMVGSQRRRRASTAY